MNQEKDLSTRIQTGKSTLQVGDEKPRTFEVYQLPPDLPRNEAKREACFEHMREGVYSELMSDFNLGGVVHPEANEPQEITTQISCKGVSCILKKCGLKVEQFDLNGVKISEMRVS